MIRIYNTLTKTKEEFKPVQEGKAGIYLCGPTVYKPSHIGHMVGPVIFDAVKRYLAYNGYDVHLVINITDVDDKIIGEANARNTTAAAVADEMTADYWANLEAMSVKESVYAFPKVSDYIPHIINFVQKLIDNGFAYESEGDVYYDVGKFPDYGKLSHRSIEQMSGEGGSTAAKKHTPFDFALWKSAKPNEPFWESPWGKGRPGWHIECSVMSMEILGETFDIHGGGLDLVFPHHENEVAQSEARHGKPMCNFWMHNGLMQASSETGKLGGRNTKSVSDGASTPVESSLTSPQEQESNKISKSKGANAFRDMLKQFTPETIRFFLLSTHYRRPIDFSTERIEEVGKGLETFYRFFKRFEKITGQNFYQLDAPAQRNELTPSPVGVDLRNKFLEFMDDDFNTGGAVGVLFDFLRTLNKFIDDTKLEEGSKRSSSDEDALIKGATLLRELALTLGLFIKQQASRQCNETELTGKNGELIDKLLTLLIELRQTARKNKDFATADKIRNDLQSFGVILTDRPDGTEWTIG
ncbi:cysteine--tRNA ligase [Planctomycetales bacterium]|nr:cysteine--tRNA ligase [Planctomycetales bacterium]